MRNISARSCEASAANNPTEISGNFSPDVQTEVSGKNLTKNTWKSLRDSAKKANINSCAAAEDDCLWRIWKHPLFQESLLETERLERNRVFCGHDRNHLLDVARIAYIENLETGANIPKYLIYAAALLHDIGRHLQYTKGVPHHEASARIASKILPECGFSQEDTRRILDAVLSHRDKAAGSADGLSGMIYRADKRSRCCFACPAEPECDWSREKKNMTLTI